MGVAIDCLLNSAVIYSKRGVPQKQTKPKGSELHLANARLGFHRKASPECEAVALPALERFAGPGDRDVGGVGRARGPGDLDDGPPLETLRIHRSWRIV